MATRLTSGRSRPSRNKFTPINTSNTPDLSSCIISTLSKGEIYVTDSENKKQNFSINGGVIEMQKNKIIVLAE